MLHVGCVDHLPLIDEKIEAETWMHEILCSVAAKCGGIDTNAEGIEALRKRGYDDLWVGDPSETTDSDLMSRDWDVLFLGEMLEHVDDPVGFLRRLHVVWAGRAETVVVTVPNALSWSTIRGGLGAGTEVVNTDHRYWFTPFTLAKVAHQAGFDVEQLYMCESFEYGLTGGAFSRLKQSVLAWGLRRRPIFRSVIVAELGF